MDILLAAPDRDFLDAFYRRLTLAGHTVTTVFDGTQVIVKLSEQRFGLVILHTALPRIPTEELLTEINHRRLPSIVLTERGVRAEMLLRPHIGSAYLSLPFLPEELLSLIDTLFQRILSERKLSCQDIEVDTAAFRLCDKMPVSEGEISLLEALVCRQPIDQKCAGPYISALNRKLEQLHKTSRIRYLINDGFRLVTI